MNLKKIIYILMISVTVLSCEQTDIWGDGNSVIDDINPTMNIRSTSNTKIEVTFSENIKDDSHEIEGNYSIDGLDITGFLVDSENPLKVTLTVDSQIENNYALNLNNITDNFDNELLNNPRTFTADKLPVIDDVTSISATEIEVTVSERVDTPTTYSIVSGSISITPSALSVTIKPDSNNLVLLVFTAEQTSEVNYTLTMDLTDNHGNTNTSTIDFTGYTAP